MNQSWHLVGDRFSDIQAGINAGLKSSILLQSKHEVSQEEISKASTFCQDLAEAASWIIGSNPRSKVGPAKAFGAIVGSSVSSKTDFLIIGGGIIGLEYCQRTSKLAIQQAQSQS